MSSLVLRAWTEGDELRVMVTSVLAGRPPAPVLVTSIDSLIDVVRTWVAVDLDRNRGRGPDRDQYG